MLLAIGPTIVVSGSLIRSGELINVPVQAACFGFVLFWAVILSCLFRQVGWSVLEDGFAYCASIRASRRFWPPSSPRPIFS